jgi:hypothetical protein
MREQLMAVRRQSVQFAGIIANYFHFHFKTFPKSSYACPDVELAVSPIDNAAASVTHLQQS